MPISAPCGTAREGLSNCPNMTAISQPQPRPRYERYVCICCGVQEARPIGAKWRTCNPGGCRKVERGMRTKP